MKVWKKVYINLEYTNYLDTDTFDIGGVSAGFIVRLPFPTDR